MKDFSKLSDAEIAERVCRKLGWDQSRRWFKDNFNIPWGSLEDMPTHTLPTMFSFNWPAPIMMAKVKEWLIKQRFTIQITFGPDDGAVNILQEALDTGGYKSVDAYGKSEPRALYEAFLQVGVAND